MELIYAIEPRVKDRKYNWYRIYVGNFTIFYVVKNNIMIVSHILYSKRKNVTKKYKKLIKLFTFYVNYDKICLSYNY